MFSRGIPLIYWNALPYQHYWTSLYEKTINKLTPREEIQGKADSRMILQEWVMKRAGIVPHGENKNESPISELADFPAQVHFRFA